MPLTKIQFILLSYQIKRRPAVTAVTKNGRDSQNVNPAQSFGGVLVTFRNISEIPHPCQYIIARKYLAAFTSLQKRQGIDVKFGIKSSCCPLHRPLGEAHRLILEPIFGRIGIISQIRSVPLVL